MLNDPSHPYLGLFNNNVQGALLNLVQQQHITQQEAQAAFQIISSGRVDPDISQFVQQLEMQVAEMNAYTMQNYIKQWVKPLIANIRNQLNNRGGGLLSGTLGGGLTAPGGWGGGVSPGGGSSLFGGLGLLTAGTPLAQVNNPGTGLVTAAPAARPDSAPPPPPPTPKEPDKPAPDWKPPEAGEMDHIKLDPIKGVECSAARYRLSNGRTVSRVIASDLRIRYTSHTEALDAFRNTLNIFPDTDHKMLTVGYRELKVLQCPQYEFLKMAAELSTEVGKNSQNTASKIRTIINVLSKYPESCAEAFRKLFIGEIANIANSGGFTNDKYPSFIAVPTSMDFILKLVTGTCAAELQQQFDAIEGYRERFCKTIDLLINAIVLNLPTTVVRPDTDMTLLDDFARAIPVIWSPDNGNTYKGTEDIFNIFLTTRETINGSKTETALKADGSLKKKIDEINRVYTVVFVDRIVTWCNFSMSQITSYLQNGNMDVTVVNASAPINDMQCFLSEIGNWICTSKMSGRFKIASKKLICEVEETTMNLVYNITIDGKIWVSSSAEFWK